MFPGWPQPTRSCKELLFQHLATHVFFLATILCKRPVVDNSLRTGNLQKPFSSEISPLSSTMCCLSSLIWYPSSLICCLSSLICFTSSLICCMSSLICYPWCWCSLICCLSSLIFHLFPKTKSLCSFQPSDKLFRIRLPRLEHIIPDFSHNASTKLTMKAQILGSNRQWHTESRTQLTVTAWINGATHRSWK